MSIHEAGPYDDMSYEQRCIHCGRLVTWPLVCEVEMVEWNTATRRHELMTKVQRSRGRRFPLGALVEITRYGRCMVLAPEAHATCEDTRDQHGRCPCGNGMTFSFAEHRVYCKACDAQKGAV